ELAGVAEAVEVDVVERQPPAVMLEHDVERGARDALAAREVEAGGEALHERGLAGAEAAAQRDDVACRRQLAEPRREALGRRRASGVEREQFELQLFPAIRGARPRSA